MPTVCQALPQALGTLMDGTALPLGSSQGYCDTVYVRIPGASGRQGEALFEDWQTGGIPLIECLSTQEMYQNKRQALLSPWILPISVPGNF